MATRFPGILFCLKRAEAVIDWLAGIPVLTSHLLSLTSDREEFAMEKEQLSLFDREISPLIVPREKVVTVHPDWTLERALLVLTRRGYASVPVIDDDGKVEGVISKTDILDLMLNRSHFRLDRLANLYVRDAMNQNHSGILPNSIFSFAFDVLLDRPYIPVIDLDNRFIGILTRRVLMEKVTEFFQQEFFKSVWEGQEGAQKV
ncbi:CBS domain protein [Desmospora sp. 8437]|nr:CBS domain protein [Desmospora sp. 8437]